LWCCVPQNRPREQNLSTNPGVQDGEFTLEVKQQYLGRLWKQNVNFHMYGPVKPNAGYFLSTLTGLNLSII